MGVWVYLLQVCVSVLQVGRQVGGCGYAAECYLLPCMVSVMRTLVACPSITVYL